MGQPLQVGISAHLLAGESSYRSAGIHQYIRHLLEYLPAFDTQITAFVGPNSQWTGSSCVTKRSRLPTENPFVRAAWEQLVQPWALRRAGSDLAHGPAFVGPILSPCPSVITVHDLSFLRFPHLFRPANRLYLRTFTRISVGRARRIIAVSRHAAEETVYLLGAERQRISVVYHGVDARFRPLPEEPTRAFRARKGLPEHFLLSVGTLEPRKNLVRLIEAFARTDRRGARLVLAGGAGWYNSEINRRMVELGLENEIVLPGFIPDEELPLWYNAARALVYPSLYEGFGMPVLEALACGTPTLTSDRSALPEAAGEAALLVDPYSVDSITAGLQRMLDDDELRRHLRQRGLAHAAGFTWDKMARETSMVYHQAVCEDVVG